MTVIAAASRLVTDLEDRARCLLMVRIRVGSDVGQARWGRDRELSVVVGVLGFDGGCGSVNGWVSVVETRVKLVGDDGVRMARGVGKDSIGLVSSMMKGRLLTMGCLVGFCSLDGGLAGEWGCGEVSGSGSTIQEWVWLRCCVEDVIKGGEGSM
ncbi:hypothetical protein V6N11_067604 [Hibiscus sabdariffa]|uniref:Uncharacterized protein n=1 Tax=Hibiscus sabdariffa TaxID=183260 RepID=A0ABR2SR94_9ROSI